MWPRIRGVLQRPAEAGPCWGGASLWDGCLDLQGGWYGEFDRDAQCLAVGEPYRWLIQVPFVRHWLWRGIVARPRSIVRPHAACWRPKMCGTAVPRGHWLCGGRVSSCWGGYHASSPGCGRVAIPTGVLGRSWLYTPTRAIQPENRARLTLCTVMSGMGNASGQRWNGLQPWCSI